MKLYKLILFIALSLVVPELAAQGFDRDSLEMTIVQRRLESKRAEIAEIKKEIISDRINLTEEQAEKFWPIYDAYTLQRIRLRRKIQNLKKQGFRLTSSDEDIKKSIDQIFDYRKQELGLDLHTQEKLLEVINIRQLAELYNSEQEFIRVVLQTLRSRN